MNDNEPSHNVERCPIQAFRKSDCGHLDLLGQEISFTEESDILASPKKSSRKFSKSKSTTTASRAEKKGKQMKKNFQDEWTT